MNEVLMCVFFSRKQMFLHELSYFDCFLSACYRFSRQTQVFSVALNDIFSGQVMRAHASLSALSGQLMR